MTLEKTQELLSIAFISVFVGVFACLLDLIPWFFMAYSLAVCYFTKNLIASMDEIREWWHGEPRFKGFRYWIHYALREWWQKQ